MFSGRPFRKYCSTNIRRGRRGRRGSREQEGIEYEEIPLLVTVGRCSQLVPHITSVVNRDNICCE